MKCRLKVSFAPSRAHLRLAQWRPPCSPLPKKILSDTFVGTWSGILVVYYLIFLLRMGIAATHIETAKMENMSTSAKLAQLQQAGGMLSIFAMIPIFILLVGFVRTSVPMTATSLMLAAALIFQGASLLRSGSIHIQYAANAFLQVFWDTPEIKRLRRCSRPMSPYILFTASSVASSRFTS